MESGAEDTLLSLGVVVSLLAGIGLIVDRGAATSVVGVVLIILGVALFFPRVKNFLVKHDRRRREQTEEERR